MSCILQHKFSILARERREGSSVAPKVLRPCIAAPRHIRRHVSLAILNNDIFIYYMLLGSTGCRHMICPDCAFILRWIKTRLSNPRDSNKKHTASPEFFPGPNINLEPPFALFQDSIDPGNPNGETQSTQLIPTSHSHPPSRPSDDIIILPPCSSDDILLSPVTSFNRTKPLEPLPQPQR